LPTNRRVEVAMTIWSAVASPCNRAARLGVLLEVPDAFAYASGYINGQAARSRGAIAKAEEPSPQAIRARKVTEQLIADLWSGRDAEDHACVRRPRREADPEV
jgi:hypothetical protein